MRFRFKVLGPHVHVRVFYNGFCGELVFALSEWRDVIRAKLETVGEVLPEM